MANVLKGKVALVTAGSAGLGAAAARALASEGMAVVINYSTNKNAPMLLLEVFTKYSLMMLHMSMAPGDLISLRYKTTSVFGQT